TMPQRDCGWMQVYVEDNQEVMDMTIQAFKIAEDKRVLLPIMVCLDAFILSHTVEPVDFPDPDMVDKFLPPYRPTHAVLDPKDPMIIGSFSPPEYIQEVRYQTDETMRNALEVIEEVNKEWADKFGRDYGGLIEEYKTDGADAILITLGTVTSTARDIVDEYRAAGKKVGLVKLRFFRPYPTEEIKRVAKKCKAIGVYDRAVSFSVGGPSWIEARNALYGSTIPVINVLAGLGGRDVTAPDIRLMFDKVLKAAEDGKAENEIVWIGTRGVSP
ncbi:MAG: pyruvate ferredoxin oxidoreductase, partial [Thermoplasmata archaeon]|nr:pyruvate ferredoxin oxidoreductase [Thermoplasmata archaeon]